MILPPAAAIGAWTAWILGVVAALSVMLYVLVGRLEARRRRADFRARLREHKANQRRMMDAHADVLGGPAVQVTEEFRTVPARPPVTPPQPKPQVRVRLDPDQQPTIPMGRHVQPRYMPPPPASRYDLGVAAESIVAGIAARHGLRVPAYRTRTEAELAEVAAAHVEITGGAWLPGYPRQRATLLAAASLRHVDINQHLGVR